MLVGANMAAKTESRFARRSTKKMSKAIENLEAAMKRAMGVRQPAMSGMAYMRAY